METQTKNNLRKMGRKLAVGALALATIVGTFSSHEKDCPPITVRKTGTSCGIVLGGKIIFEKDSRFYGLVVGGTIKQEKDTKVYGASLGLIKDSAGEMNGVSFAGANLNQYGKLNGLEAGLFNLPTYSEYSRDKTPHGLNGIQVGFVNMVNRGNVIQIGAYNQSERGHSFQGGIYNTSDDGSGLQIGVYNSADYDIDKTQRSLIINPHFQPSFSYSDDAFNEAK